MCQPGSHCGHRQSRSPEYFSATACLGKWFWRVFEPQRDIAWREKGLNWKKLATAVSKGVFVFSLLVWAYIIVEIHISPVILERHYILATLVPIREDFMAVISFALSGIAFIIWEYLRS
jgi:hypothetical protein